MLNRILCILLLLFSSSVYAGTLTVTNGIAINTPTKPNILCVGNSITLGSGIGTTGGYRKYLYPLVSYRFVGPYANSGYESTWGIHAGVSGERTDEIEARLQDQLLASIPRSKFNLGESVVLIHAGTNDIDQSVAAATAAGNVIDMIDIIRTYHESIAIYVALIIPGKAASGIDANITAYNTELNSQLTTKQGTTSELYIVDMNTAFKNNANWETEYMSQNLHPSDAGYTVMAQTWATAILANE